jgi:hypothetical protein
MRMPKDAFNQLLSFLRNNLEVNSSMASIQGGEILPELYLYYCL